MLQFLASFALITTATATILVGARRAYQKRPPTAAQAPTGSFFSISEGDTSIITMRHALLFPVVGSITLVTMFLFFKYLQWFFLLYIVALALGSIAYCVYPVVHALCAGPPSCLRPSPNTAATAVGLVVVVLWIFTGHWALNNIIGIGVCIALISVMRLPSLKIAAVALVGLLLYDVYWVFLSPAHFSESVMVAVAKQEATNPASAIAHAIPGVRDLPPSWMPAATLQMPNKLSMPVWILVDTEGLEEAAGAGAGEAYEEAGDAAAAHRPPHPAAVSGAGGAASHHHLEGGGRAVAATEGGEGHSAATPAEDGAPALPAGPQPGEEEAAAPSLGEGKGGNGGAGKPRRRRVILPAGISIFYLTSTLGAVFAGFTFLGE